MYIEPETIQIEMFFDRNKNVDKWIDLYIVVSK